MSNVIISQFLTNNSIIHTIDNDSLIIPNNNIIIEFVELSTHREQHLKDKRYHLNKTNLAISKGYTLIHVFENEWKDKQEIVKSRLLNQLGKSKFKYFARKCVVKQIQAAEARKFISETHIQGYVASKLNYGLFHNDELLACMTFGKPRYNKSVDWEVLRYSSKLYSSIVGGASKIFSHFLKQQSPKRVVSYADKRWSKGNMYRQLQFKELKDSNVSYFYFKLNDLSLRMFHRSHFQKHKLQKLLTTFDYNLTEYQNMLADGYDRIWDCGNKVFIWSNEE